MGRRTILPAKYNDYPVLIPEKFELNWIVDFLDFLDIEYITFKSNKKIKVEDLIVTSYPAPSGNFHKKTLLNLRSNFLSNYIRNDEVDKSLKNVWIDMSSHRRPVKNIEELRPVLYKYKFEEIKMEDLSINEKINLLQNTDVLLGSHSSGLTNMLFMKPGSIVIDIRDPDDNIKNAFFSMASELDLQYFYMEREKDKEEVFIEPNKLDKLLATLF
jgi:capsular polysaccharide biosynthesis protein